MEPKKRLDEIAAAIRAGQPASSFQNELDRILGTQMEDRDSQVESSWEESYRQGGTDG